VEFVNEIYAAGCRNLQFDDCVWGGMVNPKLAVALTGRKGDALEAYKKLLLQLNNEVAAQAPADLVINTHVCRGNYHSTFFSSGAYDGVADLLFGEENVNAYYLEYDDERSGGFAPLAKVSGDKKVVLGLVTTKSPVLEKKEDVIARIHEAAKHVPLDRLYLSPQCGFASCEIGNKLTEEEQWAKLKLVKEIAEEVWR
jgi:methionine synthase II (cobalamin-independent)